MSNEPTRCERCPAQIRFIQMRLKSGELGKVAPIDLMPSANGNIAIMPGVDALEARVITGERLTLCRENKQPLYTNHFYTCPKAQSFRKAK